jgi:hypothetical protein
MLRACSGVLASALLLLPVLVGAQVTVKLDAANAVYSEVGGMDFVEIPITVDVETNADTLLGFQFTLNYLASCLEFNSCSPGADWPGDGGPEMPPPQCAASPGADPALSGRADTQLLIIAQTIPDLAIPATPPGEVEIVKVSFKLLGPSCELFWDCRDFLDVPDDPVNLLDKQFNFIPRGDITFEPTCAPPTPLVLCPVSTMDGDCIYYSFSKPIQGVKIRDFNKPADFVESVADGTYDLEFRPGLGIVTVEALKTANMTTDPAAFDLRDAALTLCGVQAVPSGCLVDFDTELGPNRAGDVNLDGDVNTTDYQAMLMKLLGTANSSNKVETWSFDALDKTALNPNPTSRPADPERTAPDSVANVFLDCDPGTNEIQWIGHLLGDVDGSWTPVSKPRVASTSSIAWRPVAAEKDHVLQIGVFADASMEPVWGLLFDLAYDDTHLEYLGVAPGSQSRGMGFDIRDNAERPGFVRALSVRALKEDLDPVLGEMMVLQFRVLGPGSSRVELTQFEVNAQPVLNMPRPIEVADNEVAETPLPARHSLTTSPNPFNPSTRIQLAIPASVGTVPVSIRIYDIAGRLVKTLVDERHGPGWHSVMWTGVDDGGNHVQSGIYLLRAVAGDWSRSQKLTLLK